MALDALLTQTVRWPAPERVRMVQIDVYPIRYRRENLFCDRPLTVDVDIPTLLQTGARDRASAVRKRVADALIAHRHDPDFDTRLAPIAALLDGDKNIGVRARMDFLRRKQAAEA